MVVVEGSDSNPLFAGRIEVVSGNLWSDAESMYDDISDGKTVLVKWTVRVPSRRVTLYTLEKRNGYLERWIRVWNLDDYPKDWDYEYCTTTPDEVVHNHENNELICDRCYDINDIMG
jgi:hypothetical protein